VQPYVRDPSRSPVGAGIFPIGGSVGASDGVVMIDGLPDGGVVVDFNATNGSIVLDQASAVGAPISGSFASNQGMETLRGTFNATYCPLR
jgi:hypothetical protein